MITLLATCSGSPLSPPLESCLSRSPACKPRASARPLYIPDVPPHLLALPSACPGSRTRPARPTGPPAQLACPEARVHDCVPYRLAYTSHAFLFT